MLIDPFHILIERYCRNLIGTIPLVLSEIVIFVTQICENIQMCSEKAKIAKTMKLTRKQQQKEH